MDEVCQKLDEEFFSDQTSGFRLKICSTIFKNKCHKEAIKISEYKQFLLEQNWKKLLLKYLF